MFPKIGVPQNIWFIMENPIKMDDLGHLGVPTIFGNIHVFFSWSRTIMEPYNLKPPPIYLHIYLHIQIPFSQVSPKNSLAGAEGLRWILAWLHPRPWRSPCERGPLWSHHSGRWCRPKHSGNITLGPMPRWWVFFSHIFGIFHPLLHGGFTIQFDGPAYF